MSLLNPTTDAATAAANQVLAIIRQQFIQLGRSGIQGYNAIWNNPSATPTDILAALGTNAYAVFELAGLNIETVSQAAQIGGDTAPAIPTVPAQYVLSFNEDGSANLAFASSSSTGNSSASSGS